MKKRLFICGIILLLLSSSCGSPKSAKDSLDNSTVSAPQMIISNGPEIESDYSIIPVNTSEPFIGHKSMDSETENFVFGVWQIEKLLGFADSYNDASEYPTGQKVIGDKITIEKDCFSSKGIENYNVYQYELEKPFYEIRTISYNSDSFYSMYKIDALGLTINDEVKYLVVSPSSTDVHIPVSFFIVNNG